jgi:hypothetical protein
VDTTENLIQITYNPEKTTVEAMMKTVGQQGFEATVVSIPHRDAE